MIKQNKNEDKTNNRSSSLFDSLFGDRDKNDLSKQINNTIIREKPTTKFSDIVGLEQVKQILYTSVILPKVQPQLYQGKREPPRNILLYGTPGTGKTFIAQCLAGETNYTFYSLSSSDLVSKWVGETEKLIKTLFETAREDKDGAIIFIDEIDSMLQKRGNSNETEYQRSVKTEFLVQLQGVGHNNDNIIFLAATNYPENIDPAIRRRFQKRVEIALPDQLGRYDMLTRNMNKIENNITQEQFQQLAQITEGYSGSDIKNLIDTAVMIPINKITKQQWWKNDSDGNIIVAQQNDQGAFRSSIEKLSKNKVKLEQLTYQDIMEAMKTTKKTVSNERGFEIYWGKIKRKQ